MAAMLTILLRLRHEQKKMFIARLAWSL